MKTLNKINTSQIKSQVYESCRKMIVNGTWQPGTKIPSESQLCEKMGVSRVSVRSALQALEARGYIEIRRGEGSYVNHFDLSSHLNLLTPIFALDRTDVMDVLEYRIIMEPNIIPFVIERATPEDIRNLRSIYEKMKASINDTRTFASLDEQFHLGLIDIISNKVIHKIYIVLFEIFNSTWYEICEVLGVDDGLYYHLELIKAIEKKEIEEARNLMFQHVERTHIRMSSYYNSKESKEPEK